MVRCPAVSGSAHPHPAEQPEWSEFIGDVSLPVRIQKCDGGKRVPTPRVSIAMFNFNRRRLFERLKVSEEANTRFISPEHSAELREFIRSEAEALVKKEVWPWKMICGIMLSVVATAGVGAFAGLRGPVGETGRRGPAGAKGDSGPSGVPAGTIAAFAGGQLGRGGIPDGWLICDGRAFTRTRLFDKDKDSDGEPMALSALHEAIGDSWGVVKDGVEGNALLPDLRGLFLRGANLGSGIARYNRLRSLKSLATFDRKLDSSYPGIPLLFHPQYDDAGSYQSDALGAHIHHSESHGAHRAYADNRFSNRPLSIDEEVRPKNAAVIWLIKY